MSTKMKALLTYLFYVMEPQFKKMIGFTMIMNGLFAIFSYFLDFFYPFFLSIPITLCVFLVIAGHKQRNRNWDKYVNSLPITRKEMVQADYIYILFVATLAVFSGIIGIFLIKISSAYEIDSEVGIFSVGIVYFYAVLPKIYEVENDLKIGRKLSSFSYIEGYFFSIVIHVAFFFATMLPLGFMSNEGIYFSLLMIVMTLGLTLESYKKSLKSVENYEF